MRKQVEVWQKSELTDVTTKVVNYEAFVEGKLEAPKHLARTVHDLYFEPSTRNSVRERSGVCRMRLCLPSKNLTRFRNSGRRRSWVSLWRLGSRKCFNDAWRRRPDRRAFISFFCRRALRGGRHSPLTRPSSHCPFVVSLRTADHLPRVCREAVVACDQPSSSGREIMCLSSQTDG